MQHAAPKPVDPPQTAPLVMTEQEFEHVTTAVTLAEYQILLQVSS